MMKRINIAALAIALLCGVAGNAATVSDEDWSLRFDAAEEANDQDTLADIALNCPINMVCRNATRLLTDSVALAKIAHSHKDSSTRLIAVENKNLTDVEVLKRVCTHEEWSHVREAAEQKLKEIEKSVVDDDERTPLSPDSTEEYRVTWKEDGAVDMYTTSSEAWDAVTARYPSAIPSSKLIANRYYEVYVQCAMCNGCRFIACRQCQGRKGNYVTSQKTCPRCDGKYWYWGTGDHFRRTVCIQCFRQYGKVWVTEWEACSQCRGAGERPCPDHHEKRMVARVEKTTVDGGGSE